MFVKFSPQRQMYCRQKPNVCETQCQHKPNVCVTWCQHKPNVCETWCQHKPNVCEIAILMDKPGVYIHKPNDCTPVTITFASCKHAHINKYTGVQRWMQRNPKT
ncbi:unnamed protein product [Candidula unifasciata]|uniref:Uncharacterized protein n=1 Tax=Candidula unifasciata TaxID=100452 RepID=A0A8S3ZPK8_9EUPU|nr:unnamed protein product [Candidula unifasciata]